MQRLQVSISGAGAEDRTRVRTLATSNSTIELHTQIGVHAWNRTKVSGITTHGSTIELRSLVIGHKKSLSTHIVVTIPVSNYFIVAEWWLLSFRPDGPKIGVHDRVRVGS